jgi:hypothetical protein
MLNKEQIKKLADEHGVELIEIEGEYYLKADGREIPKELAKYFLNTTA